MIGSHGLKAKRWPHEESARIPLLIRYPRSIKPGTVSADPIGPPDLYPTLAGLAGLAAPVGLDGVDFSPLLRGETSKPPRDYVYLEMQYAYVPWPGKALHAPAEEKPKSRKKKGPAPRTSSVATASSAEADGLRSIKEHAHEQSHDLHSRVAAADGVACR